MKRERRMGKSKVAVEDDWIEMTDSHGTKTRSLCRILSLAQRPNSRSSFVPHYVADD